MIDYEKILVENYKGKLWSFSGNSYDGLVWLDNSPKPTQLELNALWETTQNSITAKTYITKRLAEYPTIGDQLDALWKGGDAQTEMLAKVMAVKTKYPKGQA